jgi:hypothetical protein
MTLTPQINNEFPQPKPTKETQVWQQNVHKLKTAQEYVLNNANPKDWDVLVLQEPWIDKYDNSHSTQFWQVIYPANFYEEGQPHVCSIILINTKLSTDCYTILSIKHSDITAVHFRGEDGFLSLFNICNEITNNNMLTCLDQFLDLNASSICPSDIT